MLHQSEIRLFTIKTFFDPDQYIGLIQIKPLLKKARQKIKKHKKQTMYFAYHSKSLTLTLPNFSETTFAK